MQKFKRLKELLWILVVLVLAFLLVWFLARLVGRVNNPEFNADDRQQAGEEEIQYYAGNLVEWGDGVLKMNDVIGGEIELMLQEGTQYQIRNPKTGMYEDYAKDYILPGSQIYVEVATTQQVQYASRILAESATNLAGRVVGVDGDVVLLEDYAGVIYRIMIGQTTVIYKTGGEDELTVNDIQMDKDIVVNSARVYEDGVDLEAGWIEVIDESEYVNNE